MSRRVLWNRSCLLLGLFAVVGGWVLCGDQFASQSDAQDRSPLQTFMRKKLDASSEVLEGLAVEDFDQIRKGASAMLEMSKSEKWNVLTDEDYRLFNSEFRSTIRKLTAAAEEKNMDSALLQWMDATKSCVECHKYVRQQRVTLKK